MSTGNPDKKRAAQSPAKFRGPAAGFDGRNLYVSNLPYQVRPVRCCVQRAWRMASACHRKLARSSGSTAVRYLVATSALACALCVDVHAAAADLLPDATDRSCTSVLQHCNAMQLPCI